MCQDKPLFHICLRKCSSLLCHGSCLQSNSHDICCYILTWFISCPAASGISLMFAHFFMHSDVEVPSPVSPVAHPVWDKQGEELHWGGGSLPCVHAAQTGLRQRERVWWAEAGCASGPTVPIWLVHQVQDCHGQCSCWRCLTSFNRGDTQWAMRIQINKFECVYTQPEDNN